MKTLLKVLGGIVAALVVLVLAAVVVVPLVVDPNDYKDRIAQAVEARTGRDFAIRGDIGVSVFPWLGVRAEGVQLGNAPGFPGSVMLRTEEARIRVKLVPLLLERRVVMDTLNVRGLTANLAVNEQGETNWASLVPADGGDDGGPPVAGLTVGGLDVRDSTIVWRDARSGASYTLRNLRVQSGPVEADAPVALELAFDLQAEEPAVSARVVAQGQLGLELAARTYRVQDFQIETSLTGEPLGTEPVRLTLTGGARLDQAAGELALTDLRLEAPALAAAGVKADVSARTAVSGNLESGVYQIQNLEARANLSGEAIPGGKTELNLRADASLDTTRRTAALRGLRVKLPAMLGQGVAGNATLQAEAVGDLAQNSYTVEAMELDAEVFGEAVPGERWSLAASGMAHADLGEGRLSLTELRVQASELQASGAFTVHELLASPRFEGSLEVAPFDPRALLARIGQRFPTRDPEALAQASLSAELAGTPASVSLSPLALRIDETELRGSLSLPDLGTPAVRFELAADRLNADRYLPPAEAAAGQDEAPGASAPTAEPNAAPGAGAAPAALAALPLERLRALDVAGRLRLGALQVAGLRAEDVDLAVGAQDGQVRLGPAEANLYQGKYSGELVLDASAAEIRANLDQSLAGVRFGPLLEVLAVEAPALAGAAGDVALRAKLSEGAETGVYDVSEARLETDLRGDSIPGGRLALEAGATAALDLPEGTVAIDLHTLEATDLAGGGRIRVSGLAASPRYEGKLQLTRLDPRSLLSRFGTEVHTADPEALSSGSLETTFQGTPGSLTLEPVVMQIDRTTLGGRIAVPSVEGPSVRFDLALDTIDLDRYLPPPGEKAQGAGSPGAAAAAAGGLPVETLQALDLDGRLRAREVKMARITVSNVDFTVKAEEGLLTVHPATASLYGGGYSGNIQLDARGRVPRVRVDERLTGVQAGPLLEDLQGRARITGIADLHVQAQARGSEREGLVRSLQGQGEFLFQNGAVRGVNIGRLIRVAKARLEGRPPPPEEPARTDFTEIRGSVQIRDGVAHNEDLEAKSPLLRVTGRGAADLVREVIDYRLTTAVVATGQGQAGPELAELSGVPIPIRVQGPLASPSYGLDVAAVAQAIGRRQITGQVEKKVEKKLEKKLEKELGGEAGEAVRGLFKGLLQPGE